MSQTAIDGLLFKEMLIAGANLLEQNRETIDAMNVFPVPDGDTGTNMSLTMKSTIKEIEAKDEHDASQLIHAAAKGALKGARGNSGVILSQILRGFSKGVDGAATIDAATFAAGLKRGADTAYKAVMKPKEGTILTVIRVISEDASRYVQRHPDNLSGLLDKMIRSGEAILAKTPEMLPALKQAGVVDSGGQGLITVLRGWRAAFNGERIEPVTPAPVQSEAIEAEPETLKYKYAVSYQILYINEGVTEDDINKLRTRLTRIGDKVSVGADERPIQVKVNTNDPGKAVQYACDLGELTDISIENKAEARRALERKAEEERKAAEAPAQEAGAEVAAEPEDLTPLKPYGFVTISIGAGFSQIFTDLGVDYIVEGGQTMNPSIEDILDTVNKVHAETVFVLPNNSNVILAASQAAELADRRVVVIPTKNTAMGVGAVIAFNPDASPEENLEEMTAAAQQVKTGQITYAVRDTVFEDKEISEGDIIGIHNGRIEVVGKDIHDMAIELINLVVEDGDSLITIYYGADTSEEDANRLCEEIAALYPDLDVEVHYGGQPLYYYLLSAE
ncbi:MAG: DAK2 domain-containing protein [Clostridia bacterium]|nr:DAK2 domain-containing protein [Clostridia bacterium]